ncbi:outer membrane beta-barrel protein [Chitinophaga pinensis]|uniref:Outer membrane protein beta-barrel domain-containing protein n=1 Tax=Chitinophaga pinensis (strain ATCC 43595 / DSM 2588 / LMG 13176 / NBRC 15968 / NCIMB 11800 / UQM 2034) TaxID=485918 RepID=A0A979GSP9_CHIPD|nr:outer membrane beta-barrel protein [Chitinophaga pinensis]ACU61548.1 hypothetical protein Cpin_4088 [Chitinophaga pinensis DSM 2588]
MRNFTAILIPFLALSAQLTAQTKPATPADTSIKSKTLKEVVVESRPPVRMKGDTVEYNASQFKTKENAVVEDLLKKLPGVKVDQGGNITAQGETVGKILVDGKEFFGNDPAIATKNLPADMVDKIQVLDKMSDQEEFTGIDDGNKTKTINIVTKKDRKKGYFGNLSAGIGPDGKYEGGVNVNSFSGEQQFSVLFKANNVNKSGFSASELVRMLGANPELFNSLPSSAIAELSKMKGIHITSDDPAEKVQLARPTGLNNTQYGGVNYNNDWSDRLKLRSSYFYNRFTSANNYMYDRHYQLPDTAYNYLQQGRSLQENNNHRVNGSFDIKLDKYNSLKISPVFNSNTADLNSNRSYRSTSADGKQLLNEGTQQLNTHTTNNSISGDILYRHRFQKPGRTLSLTVTPQYLKLDNSSLNISQNHYLNLHQEDSINQQLTGHSESYSLNNNLVYTEQLSRHTALRLTEQFNVTKGDYEQIARNYNHADGNYNVTDSRYSDIYNNAITRNVADVSVAGNYKKLTYTAGLSLENSIQQANSAYRNYQLKDHYNTLLPHLYARYRFSRSRQLMLRYASQASLPGISQLRPIEDISDPLYTRKGNTQLRQAVNHALTIGYLSNNMYRRTFSNVQLRLSTIRQQFTDAYTIDSTGRQLIMPTNANGYYNGSLHGEYSFPVIANGSTLTLGTEVAYNQYPSYFNAISDMIRQWTITPDFDFSYYPVNALVINLRGNATWNNRHSEVNKAAGQQYWFFQYSLDFLVSLPWKMNAEAGLECYTTTGLNQSFNNTVSLLNMALTKDIGKTYALHIEARDLLNQNNSYSRIAKNGYIEDRQNIVLGRYYMISLICKIKKFKK